MMRRIQRLKVADQRAFQLVCFATQPVPVAGEAAPFLPFRSAVLKGAKLELGPQRINRQLGRGF